MKKTTETKQKKGRKRIGTAVRNLEKMEKAIAPYVTRRKIVVFSTAGKWKAANHAASADF